MTQDEILDMAMEEAEFVSHGKPSDEESELFVCTDKDIVRFAHLVADKATEEANARANASWTLMCKKMVAIEREALAQPERTWVGLTNDELTDLFYNTNLGQQSAVAQAIALLKEKNGYVEEKNT
jgi:hypothetical protein